MIELNYYNKLDIFHEHFVGSFSIDDLISHYKSVGLNKQFPRKFNVIVDYTQAEFIFNINDLDRLGEAVSQYIKNYQYVKAAILHSKPYEQAISMMFEELVKNIPNFYTEIFSTKESAIKWLLLYDIEFFNKNKLSTKEQNY